MAYRNLSSYIYKIVKGLLAITVRFYDDANKKNGTQWGASRRITGVTNGQKLYSIIKTRDLPVDLKAREFSYTGNGLIARFYTGFTPVVLPAEEDVFNLRPANPAARDFSLYAVSAPASLGTLWSYELFVEGNTSNQGRGNPDVQKGYGWIIDPDTEVLLEIESLGAQNISATLIMYNGELDLPLKD